MEEIERQTLHFLTQSERDEIMYAQRQIKHSLQKISEHREIIRKERKLIRSMVVKNINRKDKS